MVSRAHPRPASPTAPPTASVLGARARLTPLISFAASTTIAALTAGCGGVADPAREVAASRSAAKGPATPAPPAGVTAVLSAYTTCRSTTYHASAELTADTGTEHLAMSATIDADPNPSGISVHGVAHIPPNTMESLVTGGIG